MNLLLIINWLLGKVSSVLVSETIRISILPLTPPAKKSILFLIEFVSMCAMIMLFIFLTLDVFSLVVRSCSSDSQVAETGNGRLSFEGLSLHSGDSLRIGISKLLFTFVSLKVECLGVEKNLVLFFILIPKHSLSYQNLRIVFKKFNANLPTAFYLRWSPLTLKWFSVILLWLVTCILRLSNCARNFATTDVAFAESALIIGVDRSSWQHWCCLWIKVFSFKSFFEIRGISSPHTNNHVVG